MNETKRKKLKVAVLTIRNFISFEAIVKAIEIGILKDKATVEVLMTIKRSTSCKRKAKEYNIPYELVDFTKHIGTREEFDMKIIKVLDKYKCDLIVFAGMRIVSQMFIDHFNGNIINFHNSLLPSFKGMHACTEALDYGVKVSGATIHFIDAKVDNGPIIIQKSVPVYDNDTPYILMRRIIICANVILPKAIELICDNKLHIEGRIVKVG